MEDPYQTDARPSFRNLIGVFILIFGLMLYAFGAAAIGDWLEERKVWLWVQMAYYLFAGILWLFPARYLFKWLGKGRTPN
ncbi:DUF2842 domain-containing protein [Temperatibacter marinus]|uniref:DUF2842 domain-containing protein n=1 Tax=Temperatibacter marinus TaxID=1456591 RepID=A0AA52EHY7_9PROT|nr:DUF2842 domain-containing protein [Temperatibacter marinus]WND03115.1 DUF2842 domain-containing protein [Temperatibacter marinus]